ncbi:restriction endonuclease [Flagellimonas lutimaris]|uniref:restriction endonuclease n=1 Tax=Flagellimonas lutimaris TaxID=475082 RepID=UPI003F5CF49E
MGYFENRKRELNELLQLLKQEKKTFAGFARNKEQELDRKLKINQELKAAVDQLAKERQIGFPWLANAYVELLEIYDKKLENHLRNKKHPAIQASKTLKEQNAIKRQAIKDKKIAEYIVQYYESIAPFLVDLKEEVEITSEEEVESYRAYTEKEKRDATTHFLTIDEYRNLSTAQKNQLALDRYKKRPKSKSLIGKLYERYIGYLYESQGYDVEYIGIFKGFEDLGRDLVCKKENEILIIQCKNWSKFKTIYEKHIFQFFGTVFQYKYENPQLNVKPVFYCSTKLSDLANRFASELEIEVFQNFKYDNDYPCIKCNISKRDKEKIYHLPFDQQYDKIKIEPNLGEFYCSNVAEAESRGFRRAFRYTGKVD